MDSKFQSKLRVLDTDDVKQKTSLFLFRENRLGMFHGLFFCFMCDLCLLHKVNAQTPITANLSTSIFKRRIFTRKVIYRLFQLNVRTFRKCKHPHACALRDCLGVSRSFVSDTSPKCIDREGLKRRRKWTRQRKPYICLSFDFLIKHSANGTCLTLVSMQKYVPSLWLL